MATERICPGCGRALAGDAPQGLCPECLIKAGFDTGAAPEPGKGTTQPLFTPPPVTELAKLFPQLEILDLVGRGGMGAVYRARQASLQRPVALKVLPPQPTERPGFAERFTREAQALARLNHPNIVAVHEFGEAGGMPYFIMEYVEGLTLRQLVQQRRLGPREALQIVPQICDALQYAHDEGVVHRDIKPENILIDRKGRVKIADFGIAKILGGDQLRQSLTQGQVLGTPHYMAPEQIEHPQAVDHRADIYSLGVVFYEMLTGELPLGKFASPSRKVDLDVRLDEIILHALEKEPERRYQHAHQVKTDVETVAEAAQVNPPRSSARSWWLLAVFLVPPTLFTIFVLMGYRWVGVDLDADIQAFTGMMGLPVSTGLGALLAWAAWFLMRGPQDRSTPLASQRRQWSWLALGAAAVLSISLPLGGASLVLLQLASQDPSWHPARGEFVITIICIGGAVLSALAATFMGWESLARIRRAPASLRGRAPAVAAAWYWPYLLACVMIAWGANSSLSTRHMKAPITPADNYDTVPVTRGPLKMIVAASGRLDPGSGDPSNWQIEASIPETCIGPLEIGQEVECVVDAFPDRPFKGKLTQLGDTPQSGQQTVSYAATVQFAQTGLKFRQGMSVMLAFIIAQRQDALRIPCQALFLSMPGAPTNSPNPRFGFTPRELALPDASYRTARTVWVVRETGKEPESVPVRIGISDSGLTEVVEGLHQGDRVVVGVRENSKRPE